MKRVLLVFMLLAACSKEPQPDKWAQVYKDMLRQGVSPAEAKAAIAVAQHPATTTPQEDREIKYYDEQRVKDAAELRRQACKVAPYADGCS